MNKTYAVSDIHGMKPLWDQIMKYLDPNDTLYCLGDCADRGNDGWEIIKDAIADKRVIYLKGNHENMLLETMKDYLKDEGFYYDYALLCNNGGAKTFEDWQIGERANPKWYHELAKLSLQETYMNKNNQIILLSHAGYTFGDRPNFYDLIWSREHFYDPWPEGSLADRTFCIHGHTPFLLMPNYDPYIAVGKSYKDFDLENMNHFWYCDGHKCDIDNGSFATGKTCLIDLDTFETIEFTM